MTNATTTEPTATTEPTEEPKSYLMWIGKEHYPTIADYVNEATSQGVSKRVANPDLAAKLAVPGTMVYLAHDEGERVECQHCLTSIENPERRKAEQALQAAERDLDNRKRDLAKHPPVEEPTTEQKAALARAKRLVANAEAKVEKLTALRDAEPEEIKAGSGGSVTLKDGSVWDYRRYMYWRNQPKKWDAKAEVEETKMCPHCGGFGQLPVGKVFGVFMPEAAEYILKAEDGEKVTEEMKAKGIITVTQTVVKSEAKRGCGVRKPGGSYVITKTSSATPEELSKALNELVAAGVIKPEDAKVNGSFVEFINPVSIEGEKRFRGVKVWDPTPEAADEGEMIADAAVA